MAAVDGSCYFYFSTIYVKVLESRAMDNNVVRIWFDCALEDDDTLKVASSYSFSGGLTASSAALVEGFTDRVDVQVLGTMTPGASYTVTVNRIHAENAVRSAPDPLSAYATFKGAGQNLYISPTGNDATGLGTETSPWQTFTKALTEVSAASTIWFKPGIYTNVGGYTVGHNKVTLRGTDNRVRATITATVCGGGALSNVITADSVYAEDIYFRDINPTGSTDGSSAHVLYFNTLAGTVYLQDTDVHENTFAGGAIGVGIYDTKCETNGLKVYDITGSTGIYINTSTFAELSNTEVYNIHGAAGDPTTYGIYCWQTGNSVINLFGCRVHDITTAEITSSLTGIRMRWSDGSGRVENCEVYDVVSEAATVRGLWLYGTPARRPTVKDCDIRNIDSRGTLSNITSVEIWDTSLTTPAGANATFNFNPAGTLLDFAAPGDAAGVPVNIGTPGRYTLTSATVAYTCTVHVIGALPGVPAVDTIQFGEAFGIDVDLHATDRPGAWLSRVDVDGVYSYGTGLPNYGAGIIVHDTTAAAAPFVLLDYVTVSNAKRGVEVHNAANTRLQRSVIHHCVEGVMGHDDVQIYNCVIDWTQVGIHQANFVGPLHVLNTCITRTADRGHGTTAVIQNDNAPGGNALVIDYSNIWDYEVRTLGGDVTEGSSMLADADPYYMNRNSYDYRVFALGPGVNKGTDLDITGRPLGILFFGNAPDVGAFETTLRNEDDILTTEQEFIDACLDPEFWDTDVESDPVAAIVRAFQISFWGELRAVLDGMEDNWYLQNCNDLTRWSAIFPVYARELTFEQFRQRVLDLWFARSEACTVRGKQRVATAFTGQPMFEVRYEDYPNTWIIGTSYIGHNNYVAGSFKLSGGTVIEVYGKDEIRTEVETELLGQLDGVAGSTPLRVIFRDERQPSDTLLIKDGFNGYFDALMYRTTSGAINLPYNMRFTFDGLIEIINPKLEASFRTYPIDTSSLAVNDLIFGIADRVYMDNVTRVVQYRVGASVNEASMGTWTDVTHMDAITIVPPATWIQFRVWIQNTLVPVDSDATPRITIEDFNANVWGSGTFDYELIGTRIRWRAPKDRDFGSWVTIAINNSYRIFSKDQAQWVDIVTSNPLPAADFQRSIQFKWIDDSVYQFCSIMLREAWS